MKLEVNYKKKTEDNTNTGCLNNMLLNNQLITEEIKRKIKKYLETSENGNTTFQNLQTSAKAVLRRKFILIQAYLRKQEKFQISNLTLHLKELEKKPKLSRR